MWRKGGQNREDEELLKSWGKRNQIDDWKLQLI